MRILIDECLDERFRNALTGHDCQTARYAGLAGLKNGELLTAAEAEGPLFDCGVISGLCRAVHSRHPEPAVLGGFGICLFFLPSPQLFQGLHLVTSL